MSLPSFAAVERSTTASFLAAALAPAARVVELGSGSAGKTAVLLRALLQQHPVSYCAVDVSLAALEMKSSHKYSLAELDRLGESCGFRTVARWIDTEWPFASSLGVAV